MNFKQYFLESTSFNNLPDDPPYGFMVWPNGTFRIAPRWGDHERAAGGPGMVDRIIKQGGVRVARPIDGETELYYVGEIANPKPIAKKTAMDLANFYNHDIKFYGVRS